MESPHAAQHNAAGNDALEAHHDKANTHQSRHRNHNADLGFDGHALASHIVFQIVLVKFGINEPGVEACAMEFEKWSPSDSNFSNKLDKGTFRYLQAKQLAEILGYEIVWRRRRDD